MPRKLKIPTLEEVTNYEEDLFNRMVQRWIHGRESKVDPAVTSLAGWMPPERVEFIIKASTARLGYFLNPKSPDLELPQDCFYTHDDKHEVGRIFSWYCDEAPELWIWARSDLKRRLSTDLGKAAALLGPFLKASKGKPVETKDFARFLKARLWLVMGAREGKNWGKDPWGSLAKEAFDFLRDSLRGKIKRITPVR